MLVSVCYVKEREIYEINTNRPSFLPDFLPLHAFLEISGNRLRNLTSHRRSKYPRIHGELLMNVILNFSFRFLYCIFSVL